ncbi:hypothetical protein VQ042_09050 [Aurantimonas sp. A2-1-M11]|uniref:hypothetical protein n=1 Tax=Aurantimonas sp. A2-1-M11 TaxID=3113712 RepID=UPI002F9378A9
MQIHTPTMLLVLSGLCLGASLCHLLEWRNLREVALLRWSAGMALIGLAAATAPLRLLGLDVLAIGGANALLLTGYALMYVGFARFCHVKAGPWWYQGNRISEQAEQAREECIVPACPLEFPLQGFL